MKKTTIIPIPPRSSLAKLGADIKSARIRRKIPTTLMAERAGITRQTLAKVEKGDAATSISIYAKVLFILGLHINLPDLVDIKNDPVGIMIKDSEQQKEFEYARKNKIAEKKTYVYISLNSVNELVGYLYTHLKGNAETT